MTTHATLSHRSAAGRAGAGPGAAPGAAYGDARDSVLTPRQAEYRVFARATHRLSDASARHAEGDRLAYFKLAEAVHDNLRLWLTLADELFPDSTDPDAVPSILLPAQYHRLLAPLGQLSLWETEYYQDLPAEKTGHPVRRFTESTFARPVLEPLDEAGRARLIAAYESVIGSAYPPFPDGRVLFPFRRLFFTLTR